MQKDYDCRAQFYFAYASLVLYSFGLENAIEVSYLIPQEVQSAHVSAPRWIFRFSLQTYTKRPQ